LIDLLVLARRQGGEIFLALVGAAAALENIEDASEESWG
jgi:hypothetical protein